MQGLIYFTASELACRCGRKECDAAQVSIDLAAKLDGLRREYNKPMTVTSCRRCQFHNAAVGGKQNSFHLTGEAVDIAVADSGTRGEIIRLAIKHGFRGIGIDGRFLHLDVRRTPLHVFLYR